MYTSSHGHFHYAHRPKRLSVRRGPSRTAAESVVWGLDVNQSPSQLTKCIPFTTHKVPELTKHCKQDRMWELRRHGRWNQHTKPSYDGKITSFVVVERLCDATVTLLKRLLDWKTPCLMHILANRLRSSHKSTWAFYDRWYKLVRHQKPALFGFEIRLEI